MTKCTWVDCASEAVKDQTGVTGEVWARLCTEHDAKLESTLDNVYQGIGGPKALLSYWIKAQGGAARMTSKMLGIKKRK